MFSALLWLAVADPDFWFDDLAGYVGFLVVPALIALFVVRAFQALRDLVRGEDSWPASRGAWPGWRTGLLVSTAYLGVMVPLTVWLST